MPTNLQRAQRAASAMCKKMDWGRDWSNGGCYLHLEVSEMIEALRGKGDLLEESGDVMFVFLSVLAEAGVDPEIVLQQVHRKILLIESGQHKSGVRKPTLGASLK